MIYKKNDRTAKVEKWCIWKIFKKSSLSPNENVLNRRFVQSTKSKDSKIQIYHARLVVYRHKDKEKKSPAHGSHTKLQSAFKTIISVADILRFQLGCQNVQKANLQSLEIFARKVFRKPPIELDTLVDEILEVLKPLYSLFESGDHLCRAIVTNFRDELRMMIAEGDLCLFEQKKN